MRIQTYKYTIYFFFFTHIYSKGLYGRFLKIIPLEITYNPMYKTEMNDKPMVKKKCRNIQIKRQYFLSFKKHEQG